MSEAGSSIEYRPLRSTGWYGLRDDLRKVQGVVCITNHQPSLIYSGRKDFDVLTTAEIRRAKRSQLAPFENPAFAQATCR